MHKWRNGGDGGDGELPELLPEGLIWRIASSLVTACQILHYGQASQGEVQHTTPGWKPIKHNDIKINNIFMKPAVQEGEFPTFVLSDFGESFTDLAGTEDVKSDNPDEYTLDADIALLPPEIYSLKLGHGYFNSYLKRFKKRDSNRCTCQNIQTPEHLLLGERTQLEYWEYQAEGALTLT
ncbi:hypothetical protein KJE20_05703 [Pyrenophora tritici-repentis]|nr:hypothetical protein KJE20_05703 [Pyrenophora tritici-repentis]